MTEEQPPYYHNINQSNNAVQKKMDRRTLNSIERDNELILKIGEAFVANPRKFKSLRY